eukprot:GHVP01053624.1.p1 GENE.GHVP01053624.1~~GHVP01053624.1.p1  ORF type:complete len:925 (-),score=172.55 GHVP01053624.1:105-2879(-)
MAEESRLRCLKNGSFPARNVCTLLGLNTLDLIPLPSQETLQPFSDWERNVVNSEVQSLGVGDTAEKSVEFLLISYIRRFKTPMCVGLVSLIKALQTLELSDVELVEVLHAFRDRHTYPAFLFLSTLKKFPLTSSISNAEAQNTGDKDDTNKKVDNINEKDDNIGTDDKDDNIDFNEKDDNIDDKDENTEVLKKDSVVDTFDKSELSENLLQEMLESGFLKYSISLSDSSIRSLLFYHSPWLAKSLSLIDIQASSTPLWLGAAFCPIFSSSFGSANILLKIIFIGHHLVTPLLYIALVRRCRGLDSLISTDAALRELLAMNFPTDRETLWEEAAKMGLATLKSSERCFMKILGFGTLKNPASGMEFDLLREDNCHLLGTTPQDFVELLRRRAKIRLDLHKICDVEVLQSSTVVSATVEETAFVEAPFEDEETPKSVDIIEEDFSFGYQKESQKSECKNPFDDYVLGISLYYVENLNSYISMKKRIGEDSLATWDAVALDCRAILFSNDRKEKVLRLKGSIPIDLNTISKSGSPSKSKHSFIVKCEHVRGAALCIFGDSDSDFKSVAPVVNLLRRHGFPRLFALFGGFSALQELLRESSILEKQLLQPAKSPGAVKDLQKKWQFFTESTAKATKDATESIKQWAGDKSTAKSPANVQEEQTTRSSDTNEGTQESQVVPPRGLFAIGGDEDDVDSSNTGTPHASTGGDWNAMMMQFQANADELTRLRKGEEIDLIKFCQKLGEVNIFRCLKLKKSSSSFGNPKSFAAYMATGKKHLRLYRYILLCSNHIVVLEPLFRSLAIADDSLMSLPSVGVGENINATPSGSRPWSLAVKDVMDQYASFNQHPDPLDPHDTGFVILPPKQQIPSWPCVVKSNRQVFHIRKVMYAENQPQRITLEMKAPNGKEKIYEVLAFDKFVEAMQTKLAKV